HDSSGTIGLIINRPTKVRLSDLFPNIAGLQKKTDTVFVGGPVGRNEIFMLIRSRGLPEGALYVMKEMYVSTSMAVLKRIANDSKAQEKFRLYDGYAGWAAGQLEREVLRGDWHVLEADAETVFERDPEKIWQELILRSSAIQTRRDSGIHLF
ncbi:MAG TPA: YqgE/AlgH family protein, partial [Thermodesulfovibrionales bacterium]|nr:YqgE/AlgH family protein [Thermodesulfovibrionales bacterium]